MSLFRCPVCGGPLERGEHTYRCEKGHSYDIAREGYTYLLPPNQKHSAAPGDDKGMAAARREFLSKGYYKPLLDTLCREILARAGDVPAILDTGCGEGYYTAGVYRALLQAGKSPRMAGIDISKFILRYAARREKGVEFAVASSYRLPVADSSVDVLLNCFSPLALEEFRRVLRPEGRLIKVYPGSGYLRDLRAARNMQPYAEGQVEDYLKEKAQVLSEARVTYTLPVTAALWRDFVWMTPLNQDLSEEEKERLALLPAETVTVDLHVAAVKLNGQD